MYPMNLCKRTLAAILVAALITMPFAGCGSETENSSATNDSDSRSSDPGDSSETSNGDGTIENEDVREIDQ